MTDIDFGTLMARVMVEMECSRSSLSSEMTENADLACYHYQSGVARAIREAFDEAEAPAPIAPAMPTCSRCGAILEGEMRFCTVCGTPQTVEAAGELLERALAKDAGTTPDDPRFRASVARLREEQPEQWAALVQKIAPRATA